MANTPRLVTIKQADALAELYVWDTVVEILEGSTAPRDASGQKAARKVIAIAKAEQKKLFRKYDAEARHDDFAALQAEIERLREALAALKAENEMLREALKDADNELDLIDEEMDTCDHSVGVCTCSHWSMRRKMKAALSKGNSND